MSIYAHVVMDRTEERIRAKNKQEYRNEEAAERGTVANCEAAMIIYFVIFS